MSTSTTRPRSVYFYCRDEEPNLQEDVIALAEGLEELGVPFFANTKYWRRSMAEDDYLFRHDPSIGPDDCDIVVVSYTWPTWIEPTNYRVDRRPLPYGLFKKGRRYRTVYMDSHDGYRTVSWEPEFREFDLILRAKFNRRAWHPPNMRPWVLGINQRIVGATAGAPPFVTRTRQLLVNFGASHPFEHGTRRVAAARVIPELEKWIPIDRTTDDLSVTPSDSYDALMWRQTGFRFSRRYYERLKSSQMVACFCGDLIPAAPEHADRYLAGGRKAQLRRLVYDLWSVFDRRPQRAIQWDSFRFWETLSAGCAAIHLDLDRYGVELPVMPLNGIHYIGFDLDRVAATMERLRSDPGLLERVAAAGHAWAMEHYSPRALAERLLQWTA